MGLRNPLFIHGWAFSSKIFGSLKGIKVDLPAHSSDPEPYEGFDKMVGRLALSLPGEHDVIGWSIGGSVALMLALRFPKKVRRLFLIGTSPFFGGAWPERNLKAFRLKIRKEGISIFRRMAYPKPFEDSLSEEGAMRMLEDYIRLDLRGKLPLLRREVFILQGEGDLIVPVREAFKLHSLIKRSKLIILPGGHFPAEDERSLLSALLKIS